MLVMPRIRRFPRSPDPVPEHTWLTLVELAELLHITERPVRCPVAEKRIPGTKLGSPLRSTLARVQGWLAQGSREPEKSMWRGRPA